MKVNTKAKVSIMSMLLLTNATPVFATPISATANVVTANTLNTISQNSISVISSKNGETVSKRDSLEDTFTISFTNDNYITTKFAKITGGSKGLKNIPVYLEASSSSQKVGEIEVGSTVVLGKEVNGFTQIFFDEHIVYIQNQYLVDSKLEIEDNKKTEQTEQKQGKYVRINSDAGLNLRQEPTTKSAVLTVIPFGAYADYIEDNNGEWLKVSYNGNVGYVSAEFVDITDNKQQDISTSEDASPKAQEIINFAKAHLGKPYIYGSINLEIGTDCSGFTYSVFRKFGINLNRTSRDQYLNGTPVEKKNLMPGDLVFFNTGGDTPISHVGIYIGDGQYIHSTDSKNRGVMISSLNDSYSLKTYYGARRVIK